MATGGEIEGRDVKAIVRLLRETHDHTGSPLDQWQCVLDGLCKLVRADFGLLAHIALANGNTRTRLIVSRGEPVSRDRAEFMRLFRFRGPSDGQPPDEAHRLNGGWEFDVLRKGHVILGSGPGAQQDSYCGLAMVRRPQRRSFDQRDCQLIDWFHNEIGWLYRTTLIPPQGIGEAQLTPRLYQTLQRLLLGENERQIAVALNLSHHTVHGYVKSLYRRFGANSRAELMASCMAVETDADAMVV